MGVAPGRQVRGSRRKPQAGSSQSGINRSPTPHRADKSQSQTSDFSDLNNQGGEGIRINNPAHALGNDRDQGNQNTDDGPG